MTVCALSSNPDARILKIRKSGDAEGRPAEGGWEAGGAGLLLQEKTALTAVVRDAFGVETPA